MPVANDAFHRFRIDFSLILLKVAADLEFGFTPRELPALIFDVARRKPHAPQNFARFKAVFMYLEVARCR